LHIFFCNRVKNPAASNGASNLKRPKGRGILPSRQSPNACKQSLGSLLAGIKRLVDTVIHTVFTGLFKFNAVADKRVFYSISLIRFTISTAPTAQSYPLFPALVPARSMACSIFSVVRTPNITGTPLSSETAAIPFDTSLHT